MTITTSRNRLFRRLKPLLAAVSLTVVLTAIAGGAEPAAAWQFASISGSAGAVVPPTIYVGDVFQAGTKYFTVFGNTGPTVYRSPAAAGVQQVRVRYMVERWDGSAWRNVGSSGVLSAQISSTQSGVRFTTAPYLFPNVTTGYFRLTYSVGWLNSAGAVLALATIVPNLTSDQLCTTVNPNRTCRATAGYVQVG